jgi:hypothetical protein
MMDGGGLFSTETRFVLASTPSTLSILSILSIPSIPSTLLKEKRINCYKREEECPIRSMQC